MRVLIADDDPLTRAGIELLLEGLRHDVVASLTNGQEVIAAISRCDPDVLVLDFDMPMKSGIDVLRFLRERGDQRAVVFLTGSLSGDRAWESLQLGLNGLVIKAKAPATLANCLDAVLLGRRWIDNEILAEAMEVSLSSEGERRGAFSALTPKEFAVVNQLRHGLTNKEIAAALHLSEMTVKTHLRNVFDKTGVRNRAELVLLSTKDPAFN